MPKLKNSTHPTKQTHEEAKASAKIGLPHPFLTKFSHELRTPLNAIIGFSELIREERVGPINEEQHEYLSDILTSAKQVLELVDQVLDLTKLEAGQFEFHPERAELPALVQAVLSQLKPQLTFKKIKVVEKLDSALGTAYIDTERFKQILYHYLDNSIKFTKEHGLITIRLKEESDLRFCLEIEDNGIGIPKAELAKIFTPFLHLDNEINKHYPSAGLGLSLTKYLVEAQGGEVGVKSSVGQGSLFYVCLNKKYVAPASLDPVKKLKKINLHPTNKTT